MILFRLLEHEPSSYGDLKQRVAGVTDRVLSTQLNELVNDGVLFRTRTGRRVQYRLTDEGRRFQPIFDEMKAWGARRQAAVARERDY